MSTPAARDGLGALEAEVLRQVRVSDGLRDALGDAEARVRDLTERLRVDEQLAELRLAVKEGITSDRVRCVQGGAAILAWWRGFLAVWVVRWFVVLWVVGYGLWVVGCGL